MPRQQQEPKSLHRSLANKHRPKVIRSILQAELPHQVARTILVTPIQPWQSHPTQI